LEARNQPAVRPVPDLVDARRQPRFKLEVDIRISSRTCGVLKGHTVDINECGISALLRIEVPLGELVELDFTLPYGPVTIYAVVRQKNAFRYGFEFVESNVVQEVIRPTCQELAMEETLFGSP
jgi:PilZ domain